MQISVVVPTKDNPSQLRNCLRSLAAQRFEEFEILIIDGSSSPEPAQQVVAQFPSLGGRVHLSWGSDAGVYDAMNIGARHTKCPFVLFLGDDDKLWNKDVLGLVAPQLTEKLDMLYGDVVVLADTPWAAAGQRYGGYFSEERIAETNICQQAIIYSRKLIIESGGFNTQYKVCADWDFNLRIFRRAKKQYVPTIVSAFGGSGISTRQNDYTFQTMRPLIVRDALGLPLDAPFFKRNVVAVRLLIETLSLQGRDSDAAWFAAALDAN